MSELTLRVDKNLFQQLKEIAKKDNRSINSLLNVLIKRCVAEKQCA